MPPSESGSVILPDFKSILVTVWSPQLGDLMGIDHTKLTYRYSGRDFRLTDVSGRVLQEIIA